MLSSPLRAYLVVGGMEVTLGRILRGTLDPNGGVAPTGFAPVFEQGHVFANGFGDLENDGCERTLRDSNTGERPEATITATNSAVGLCHSPNLPLDRQRPLTARHRGVCPERADTALGVSQ